MSKLVIASIDERMELHGLAFSIPSRLASVLRRRDKPEPTEG